MRQGPNLLEESLQPAYKGNVRLLRQEAFSWAAGVSIVLAALLLPTGLRAQPSVPVPAALGDQLFFVYDIVGPRTTFLNISNPSAEGVSLEVSFYPTSGPPRQERVALMPWGNRILNPRGIEGLAGSRGLAVVTPVAGQDSSLPVVPAAPLAGSFTLANSGAGSAFGGNALGRLAVDAQGIRGLPGSFVDGQSIRYQLFAPAAITIPTYYDPRSLDPPEEDGNRVILVAFSDFYGDRYTPIEPEGDLSWAIYDSVGTSIAREDRRASFFFSTSLQALAGNAVLDSSGKVYFAYDAPEGEGGNVFGLFSQSLQSFGAGERMPAADGIPGS